MKIQILTDNPYSWIIPYVLKLIPILELKGHTVLHKNHHNEIEIGDILFLLSCENKFDDLKLNKLNIVIHESQLPKGRGWSPLTWHVIEGKNEIPITLFEASNEIDSGNIYLTSSIKLDGTELVDDLREKQGSETNSLIVRFIDNLNDLQPISQSGEPTYYRKRSKNDSEIDIFKLIRDQFNLLRVCDNERYPAFFYKDEKKYILKIYKSDD